MWAIINNNNEVISCLHPDAPEEEVERLKKEFTLIFMTLENSPAYLKGQYKDGKFYPPVTNEEGKS